MTDYAGDLLAASLFLTLLWALLVLFVGGKR